MSNAAAVHDVVVAAAADDEMTMMMMMMTMTMTMPMPMLTTPRADLRTGLVEMIGPDLEPEARTTRTVGRCAESYD